MINKSRGDLAYTLIDIDKPVEDVLLNELLTIEGVLSARMI